MSDPTGFSININALPVVEGLGPVDFESTASTTQTSTRKPPPAPISGGIGSQQDANSTRLSPSNETNTTRRTGTTSPPRQSAMSQAVASSPRRGSSPFSHSPTRNAGAMRSSSPRHLSPATSQIFERDVQESSTVELSPAIPAHIQTEDHIPPVLEASSLAITDKALSPSDVEIVMHAGHQPAAATVGQSMAEPQSQFASGFTSQAELGAEQSSSMGGIDAISSGAEGPTYAQVDPLDPRRLSFISYADVVHAEHAEHEAQAQHQSTGTPAFGGHSHGLGARSQSPARSATPARLSVSGGSGQHGLHSGHGHAGNNSSFLGGGGSGNGLDAGSSATNMLRRGSASIASPHAHTHGDLTIETMAQALEQPLVATAGAKG